MIVRNAMSPDSLQWQLARLSIMASFGSFVVAVLLLSNVAVDRVPIVATAFIALLVWRPGRARVLAAAVTIVGLGFQIFDWTALLDPCATTSFATHLALLNAALLAGASMLFAGFDMSLD